MHLTSVNGTDKILEVGIGSTHGIPRSAAGTQESHLRALRSSRDQAGAAKPM